MSRFCTIRGSLRSYRSCCKIFHARAQSVQLGGYQRRGLTDAKRFRYISKPKSRNFKPKNVLVFIHKIVGKYLLLFHWKIRWKSRRQSEKVCWCSALESMFHSKNGVAHILNLFYNNIFKFVPDFNVTQDNRKNINLLILFSVILSLGIIG